ncbi:hypothetical protein [Nitrosomonas ureae]|uniref:Outer membrane biosynthesis protein TonB n=1 Tax=Nitrosomonas ureae TaxID=44577 RepID=A0A0S3AIW4_9PROT|nr:hypothetical protein [Nitrosomonas ureae]ALQ50992.1 hypothetical protein ATY38_06975 [Nitrosomonas ureae]PTQ87619.1 outer membrane biosynthesis protein TonB [Nitrosomonas ureae]PXX15148.1 outer membrane biosynthesis protein TonB [Nitrosomonas ureae]SDT85068.1 protein TonB, links inner and outer membranes [Nitrosomonas ureae]SEP99979.1 protein TonB, links inner and outer membranes [Nitrosomonas ureae]
MASSRSKEIRLWWPLPLATLIWLLTIWGLGFFLSLPEVEIEAPPPIAASFIDLEESKDANNSLPASQPSTPAPQPEKPKTAETKPAPKTPPAPAQPPPSRPPTKPKAPEKPSKPKAPIPAQEVARIKAPPEPPADAPTDLSEYINQAKARRRAAEGIFDSQENTASSSAAKQPSADEIRMANVRRNLQNPGTSGIFQILRIGPRTAEFSFRAWTTGQTNPRLQMIRVEAGTDGDIERAIIRRMIQLIREYYKEDFNWESHRLHRVVVLSARERDTAGLEDFLMREFFINPSR